MNSTAHLPKPADPAQMSDWRRTAFTVEAVVYYPKRTIIGVIAVSRGWRSIKRDSDGMTTSVLCWDTESDACKIAMEAAGVQVAK